MTLTASRLAVLLLILTMSVCRTGTRSLSRAIGACDGSAVVDVGARHFLSASDEDNIVRLYERGAASRPVREFALSDFLEPEINKRGLPKEADIEAVARSGGLLYWIGSHSHDRRGNRERSRDRLFATRVNGQGAATEIAPHGRPFTALRASFRTLDPAVRDALAAADPLPPQSGGVNIEGLAETAEGGLLIGFRSPLVREKALILWLLNPAEVVEARAQPAFGAAALLDLGGLGIRAVEPSSQGSNRYWLLAGSSGEGDEARLYTWQMGRAPAAADGVVLPREHGAAEGLMAGASSEGPFVSMDAGDVGQPACRDRPTQEQSFVVAPVRTR